MPNRERRVLPDPTRMPLPAADPSATDASRSDPSASTVAGPVPPPAEPSQLEAADASREPGSDASAPPADDASVAPATDPALEPEAVAPPANDATIDRIINEAMSAPPTRTLNSVFKGLAACIDMPTLIAHLEANPDILDFLASRRGFLPVFSEKPPPTIPPKGGLRTFDDYTDVVFTKHADGVWRCTKLSR